MTAGGAETTAWAYRFPLAPNRKQAALFASHAGAARYAYNWGITQISEALDAYAAEKAAGVDKPKTKIPGHFDLCKMWTAHKNSTQGMEWVGDNFVGTYQAALRDAATAWKRFLDARKGGGRNVGRPRYKKRGRARESFQMHGSTLAMPDSAHIKLPKIGVVKINGRGYRGPTDPTDPRARAGRVARRLYRALATGQARMVRVTIAREGDGQWWASVTTERTTTRPDRPTRRQRKGGTIGIDVGVRSLLVTSRGDVVPNPAVLERLLQQLRAASRALSRTQPGSRRREKARKQLAELHSQIAMRRKDYAHRVTTELVRGHAGIMVEGWDVQKTAQNGSRDLPRAVRRLRNRRLADAAIGDVRWQLEYKADAYGAAFQRLPADSPTGRTCSSCGAVRDEPVPLTVEEFTCPRCGLRIDRRVNAARAALRYAIKDSESPTGGSD